MALEKKNKNSGCLIKNYISQNPPRRHAIGGGTGDRGRFRVLSTSRRSKRKQTNPQSEPEF